MFILGISGIVWVLVFEFFTFHSVVPGFFLVLDPRGRNGGLVGTVGSNVLVSNLRTVMLPV